MCAIADGLSDFSSDQSFLLFPVDQYTFYEFKFHSHSHHSLNAYLFLVKKWTVCRLVGWSLNEKDFEEP